MPLDKTLTTNPIINTIFIDFNQNVRFNYITSNIKSILKASKKEKLTILDIGAGLGNLSEYISMANPDCLIVNVEINTKRKLPNMVVADGSRLPFVSQTFDFTVSCDVFEHVQEESRSNFIKESLRCCKRGLVLTYSKIHAKNPASSGIKIFEKLVDSTPDWYMEHNENVLVNDSLLAKAVKENGAKIKNIEPLVGVLGLFFTSLIIFVQGKSRLSVFKPLLQVSSLLITQLIEIPPFYGFGLTAVKTNA